MLGIRENGTNILQLKIFYPIMSVKRPKHLLNIGCTNPYLVNGIYFPCGHCHACLIAAMNKHKYALQWELSDNNAYKAFIMLTYRKEDLPLRRLTQQDFDSRYKLPIYSNSKLTLQQNEDKNNQRQLHYKRELESVVRISNKPNYVKAYCCQSDKPLSELQQEGYNSPTHPDGYYMLPTLQYSDVSSFLKRLRTKVFRATGKTIRFAACGEYGPKGFRPHYHVIVICPTFESREYVFKYYRSCWIYGFSNAKYYVPNKNSADYVSGYVTCSNLLPKLYRYRAYKPFFRSSNHLGQTKYAAYTQIFPKCQTREFDSFLPKKTNPATEFTAVLPSLEHSFFPKCRGFSFLSSYQREQRYTFFLRENFNWKIIAHELCTYIHNHGPSFRLDVLNRYYPQLAPYLYCFGFIFKKFTSYDTIMRTIYHDYRISQLFASSCHKIYGHYTPRQMVSLIEDYYTHKDSVNLHHQLQTLEDSEIFPQDFVKYYYNQDITSNEYKRYLDVSPIQEVLFDEYLKYCDNVIQDRIKTKKINDKTHRLCPMY